MKPLNLKPKEIDLVVASLEQALLFWDENISSGDLPEGFDLKTAQGLCDDLAVTYIKFSNLQEDMEKELEVDELPDNVLKFPGK
tara:strand:+ start:223 stop:474 length:252 start_codon:yes stop_codon:yes gene_type:complete